jgi:hypothetical protein
MFLQPRRESLASQFAVAVGTRRASHEDGCVLPVKGLGKPREVLRSDG